MTDPSGDAWFTIKRHDDETHIHPVGTKGWMALAGCILGTIACAAGVCMMLVDWSAMTAALATIVVVIFGVAGCVWLAYAKGRRVP